MEAGNLTKTCSAVSDGIYIQMYIFVSSVGRKPGIAAGRAGQSRGDALSDCRVTVWSHYGR